MYNRKFMFSRVYHSYDVPSQYRSYAALIDRQFDVSVLNAMPAWIRREGPSWQGPSTSMLLNPYYFMLRFHHIRSVFLSNAAQQRYFYLCACTSRLPTCPFA
jgi:hypothetical protein